MLVAHGYRVLRKREGLGRGDAKLFATAGAWLGWAMLPMTMLAACLAAVGLIAVRLALGKTISRESPIAFGPFLAVGLWAVWLVDSITWDGGA